MTYADYKKEFKALKAKPHKLAKFKKHNSPKERNTGTTRKKCRRCGRINGHISKYGLHYCRQCFREISTSLGFKKYY